MTREDLIALALQFRTEKLWEILDDSMIFGVRLSDGQSGYCCVMGHGGEHYGLALYIGISGFSTYINSVNRMEGFDSFEMFQTYDCLNCDYENASDSNLTAARKKLIRTVASERHIKMCRPKGYPEFIRYDRGYIRPDDLKENEMEALGMALKAGIEVARRVREMTWPEMVKLGFDENLHYPSPSGGTAVPLLVMQDDGSFKWSVTLTPKPDVASFPTPVLNAPLAVGKLKTMKRVGAYQLKAMHMPSPVRTEEGMYYPMIMVLVNDGGMVYPVMQKAEGPHNEEDILNQLLFTLISMEVYPEGFIVDDGYSDAFLKDFCCKTEIKLENVPFLPELEQVVHMLRSRFGR